MLWLQDWSVLYDFGQLRYFVPDSRMTWQQQANAVLRFVIYLSFLLTLYYGNVMVLILPIAFMMAVQYYLYQEGKLESIMNQLFSKPLVENFILRADNYLEQEAQAQQQVNQLLHTQLTAGQDQENMILDQENNPTMAEARELATESRTPGITPLTRQAQATQSNQQAERRQRQVLGEARQEPKPELGLEYQEPAFRPKNVLCKKSTEANPFGNSLPWQSHQQDTYPVCPNEFQKDQNFYRNLFNNVNDVWDRNNGQLIFNSNPSTTRINDREAFMQFLFNTPYTEY